VGVDGGANTGGGVPINPTRRRIVYEAVFDPTARQEPVAEPITVAGEPAIEVIQPVSQGPTVIVTVTTTSLLTMENNYGALYCATQSMTNLTVNDGQVRQVVGPISVNSDILISYSTLVFQAQVDVGNDLDLVESTLFVMNKTQVMGKTTIDENSGSTLIAELSTTSFALHSNASIAIGSKSDTNLLQQPLIIVRSCDIALNGSIGAILSQPQIDLILTALNQSANVSFPFLQANCRFPIPIPAIPPIIIPKGLANTTTPLLLKVGSSRPTPDSAILSMIFSLRGTGGSPTEPALANNPDEPNSPLQQSKSSNRTAIIIGASIGGTVALVAIIAILVLTVKPLNNLVFPHRKRALAQRNSML